MQIFFDRLRKQRREGIPGNISVTSIACDITTVSYQLQKAMKKPHHEKKNTLPYWLTGFSSGIDLAFLLMGLMTGAVQRTEGENMTEPRSSSYTSSSQLSVSECKLASLRRGGVARDSI
jgi:hypothetical protein